MITATRWTEHRVLDREIVEGTEGAKDLNSPMGGATVSTGQTPQDWTTNQTRHMKALMGAATYVAEDGLVGCQWEEWLLGL